MNTAVGAGACLLGLVSAIAGAATVLLGLIKGRPFFVRQGRRYVWLTLLAAFVACAAMERGLITRLLQTSLELGEENTDRLDLKIASAALREMHEAFRLFRPFHHVPKVTVFGSARTRQDDPLYVQARDVAAALAGDGWMVVTGAGPGIMQAAAEGAGSKMSLGVSIRLPFEEKANTIVAHTIIAAGMPNAQAGPHLSLLRRIGHRKIEIDEPALIAR